MNPWDIYAAKAPDSAVEPEGRGPWDIYGMRPFTPDTYDIEQNIIKQVREEQAGSEAMASPGAVTWDKVDKAMGIAVGPDNKYHLSPQMRDFLMGAYEEGTAVDAGDFMQYVVPAAVRALGEPPGFFGKAGLAVTAGGAQALSSVAGMNELIAEAARHPAAPVFRDIAEWSKQIGQEKFQELGDSGFIESSAWQGVASAIAMAPGLAAAVVTKNPNIALASAAALTGGSAAHESLAAGNTPLEALGYASTQALIEVATEKIPMYRLIGDLKIGSSFGKTLLNQIVTEIPGEIAATLGQDLAEKIHLNPDQSFSDFIKTLPKEVAATVISTAVGVSLTTGILHSVNKAVAPPNQKDSTLRQMVGEKMGKAAEFVTESDIAQAIKTRYGEGAPATKTFRAVAKVTGLDVKFLRQIYKETGVSPVQVHEDMSSIAALENPTLITELSSGVVPAAYKARAAAAEGKTPTEAPQAAETAAPAVAAPAAEGALQSEQATTPAQQTGGYVRSESNGNEVRVSENKTSALVAGGKDTIAYEVRKNAGDSRPLTMVVTKDGKLTEGRAVIRAENAGNNPAWKGGTPQERATVMDLLQARVNTAIGSPERSAIDNEIKKIVTSAPEPSAKPVAEKAAPVEAEQTDLLGEELDLEKELEDSRRFPKSGYPRSKDPTELAKTGGRDFGAFARDHAANIHKNAYIDLGLDVDRAMNMPAGERIKLVSDLIAKKFDMKVNVDPNMDAKLALDHMLDMYNSIAFMAHALGLPPSAIGLKGTLTLNIEKRGRYLGVYKPGEKSIGLPDKGNSFAHEWLHALDHFLLVREGKIVSAKGEHLFTGVIRKDGVDPMTGSRGSFVNVLNNIFFDKSHLAVEILKLQNIVENAKSEDRRKEAQETLAEIERGNYKGLKTRSEYYHGAREFSKGAGYWTQPEEMMARAFEAYLAHKVEMGGGSVKGIAKEDMGYLSNADDRLAKTFPKATDRFAIFGAFDRFFSDVGREAILGTPEEQAALPDMDLGIVDPKRWDVRSLSKDDRSLLQKIYDAEVEAFERSKNVLARIREKEDFRDSFGIASGSDFKSAVITFQQNAFRSIRTVLHSIEKHNPRSSSLREANDRLVTRPGQGEAVAEVFSEELESMTAKYQNRIDNVIEEHGIENFTSEQVNMMRDELQGRPLKTKNKKISDAATAIRTILDSMYDEAKVAGIDIGYNKDSGYLTRMYMDDMIVARKDDFIEKATEVYIVQFDRDIGNVDNIISNPAPFLETVIELLKRDKKAFPVDKVAIKDIALLLHKPDRTVEETEKLRELLEEVLPIIREYYATTAANDWYTRIEVGHPDDLDKGMAVNFTKKRSLPPEADVLLKDYMETDPMAIAKSYVERMSRKIATHNVKTPKNGVPLSKLYERILEEGVSLDELAHIKQFHDKIMGLEETGAISQSISPMTDWMYTFGTVMLLGRAVFASISEPAVAAIKTGNVLDAARYLKYSFDQLIKTEDAQAFNEVSRFIGLVSNDMVAQSIDARLGGTSAGTKTTRRILSNFFRKTLLTPLTNQQRQVVLRVSYRYFQHLSGKIVGETGASNRLARRELAEYGIPEDQAESFSLWMETFPGFIDSTTGMPSKELDTPFGKMLMTAMRRFNKQAIQDPKAADRPYFASTPVGRILYSVTAFSFSFWDNVTKAQAAKIIDVTKTEGGYEGAKMFGKTAAGFASLYAATFLVQMLRVALFDREKWEELDKEDELQNYLMKRALAYTNIQGPVIDFFVNAFAGIKWQRDIATAATGAHLSSYFDFLQKIGQLFAGNSPNTNTAERNAAKSTWRTLAGPSVAMGLSLMPGGPLLGAIQGAGIMAATSNTAATAAADIVAGEKNEKSKKKKAQ